MTDLSIVNHYRQSLALRSAAISFLPIAVLLFCPASQAGDVILLHSTDKATAWTDAMGHGLSMELTGTTNIVPFYLGLDVHDDDHFETKYETLVAQWQGHSPMAVVTDGATAFAFMRKYREDLFVGTTVLYCGIPRPEPEYLSQCGDCAGIPIRYSAKNTVDLVFALQPATTIVVGITDGTPKSQVLRMEVENRMQHYSDRAQVVFPGHELGDDKGLDLQSLASVASSVPRSGAVLYLGFTKDTNGLSVDEDKVIHLLTTRSEGPVYTLSDQWIGRGVLGGVVVRASDIGRKIGRMTKRILAGEPAREMLGEAVKPLPVIDLTELTRRGISTSLLPKNTLAVNIPQHPEESRSVDSNWLTIGIAILVCLIVLLLIRRSRARKGM